MSRTYYIQYNGVSYTDSQIAHIVYNNDFSKGGATERVKSQIDWIVSNCTNINNITVENVLEYLWYNLIGISNNELWKAIADYTNTKVEQGLIAEW